MASYDIEPFLPSYGDIATDSAYPHSKSPLPVCITLSLRGCCWLLLTLIDSLMSTSLGH